MREQLENMLGYCRPHGSVGESMFVEEFIRPLDPVEYKDPQGEVLAYVVRVNGGNPRVLFSSHVDTVHAKDSPVFQVPKFDEAMGLFYKDDNAPLGADNAAGVWLLLRMIEAKVPGTYIFHRGEERGGIGSSGMAMHHVDFLCEFDHAIAFDRRGTSDVITHQMVGRTCSDAFALALSEALNVDPDLDYAPDRTGLFTDTANYIEVIPECTNVSVGYYNEHTGGEHLDVWHLETLTKQLIEVFGTGIDLPIARTAAPAQDDYSWRWDMSHNTSGPYDPLNSDFPEPYDARSVRRMAFNDLVEWARVASPGEVAGLLMDLADEAGGV